MRQGTAEQIGGALTRISRLSPASGIGAYISAQLAELAITHAIPPERMNAFWDQLLVSVVGDVVGYRSGVDAGTFGAWFAEQGYSLPESLQVVLGLRGIAIEALHRQVIADGRPASDAIAGMELISLSMNEFTVRFDAGYFEVELANRARQQTQHHQFVLNVLSGMTSDDDGWIRFGAYGLEIGVEYRAFRAHPSDGAELAALEAFLELDPTDGNRSGLYTVIDGDVCGFVAHMSWDPAPILIGVSLPVPITDLPSAFRRATRAFHSARRARLEGVHTLEDLGILVAVTTDADIAEVLDQKYLQPLRKLGAHGETQLATLRCYLDNNAQLEATARELGIHVNTVRYRLAKFEERFDVSLSDTKSLAELWWMLHLPASESEVP